MAESVGLVSLAASIIAFIDFGTKVLVRLQALRTRIIEVSKEFRDMLVLLPRIFDILGSTRQLDVAGLIEKPAQFVFLPLVQSCYVELLELNDILRKITPGKLESSTHRAEKALQSTTYLNTVDKISSTLQKNIRVFTYSLGQRRARSQSRMLFTGSKQANIPFDRNSKFVGRASILHQIGDSIEKGRNIALAGLGGVGKTQIALEAAYRYKETQHGRVFWVSGSNFHQFDECYKDIAHKFMTLSDIKPEHQDVLLSVRDWLNEHGPWLMVLDDADDIDLMFTSNAKSRPLIDFLPCDSDGSILITSRNMRVSEGFAGTENCIAILAPDQNEAEDLLRSEIPPYAWDSYSANNLVQLFGRLPLALNQAAAFIRLNNFTLDRYLKCYRQDIGLVALPTENSGEIAEHRNQWNAVVGTSKLSIDQITMAIPLAAKILSLMSVLDSQGVPSTLLESLCNSDAEFMSAIGTLQAYSLITVEQKALNTFAMHRLVQSTVHFWMESDERLVLWHRKALTILQDKFVVPSSEDSRLCQVLYPHARLVVEYKFKDSRDLIVRAKLMTQIADYEVSRNRLDIAKTRLESACEYMTKSIGSDSLISMRSQLQLASVLRMQGSEEVAERICRELLPRFFLQHEEGFNDVPRLKMELALSQTDCIRAESILRDAIIDAQKSDNPWDSARVLDNLGFCLLKRGELKDTVNQHLRALDIKMRLMGPKNEWTLLTETISNCKTNPFDTNEGISRQTLARQEQTLGPEHPDTLLGVFNLAKSLIRAMEYSDAEPLALRALTGSKKVLGAKHLQTLFAMESVALLYKCTDRQEFSAKYFEKALKGFDKVLGQDDPATRSCWWGYLSLAWEWRSLDKDASKSFPADHPVSLIRLNYEAGALYDNGDYRQAEKLQRKSLALFEAAVGPDDLWTLTCACDLGLTLIELWSFSEAEALFRRVLEGRRKKLEPDHRDTLKTMNALGVTLWNMKGEKLAESEALFRELLATRERLGQTEDVSYLSTRNNLALLEFERGDNEAALKTHRELLVDRQRIQGKNHPETLLTMLSISMALGYMHKFDESLEWNEKAVTGLLIFPGPDHPTTLVARSHLAKIQSMLGKLDAAEETIRSVIAARSKVLGPGHGNTLKSRARLGGILELQGRLQEALALEEDIYTVAVASLGVDHPESRGHKSSLEALKYRLREMDVAAKRSMDNIDDASRMEC